MIIYDLNMVTTEVKPITVRTTDLQTGEVLLSATALHTPPSGDPIDIDATIDGIYVNMLFGPFAVPGYHFVKVQPVGDNGSEPVVLYQIRVRGI